MNHLSVFVSLCVVLLLSGCSRPLPNLNYDASNQSQRQFDKDSADCELAMARQYGGPMNVPPISVINCMQAKGWHY